MSDRWTEMADEQLTNLCSAVSHSPRLQYVAREARYELLSRRALDLRDDEFALLVGIRDFIQEQIDSGGDGCGDHRLQVAVLDKLIKASR